MLPEPPNSKNNYDFDGTIKYMRGWLFTAGGTQLDALRYSWLPLVSLREVGLVAHARLLICKLGHAPLPSHPPLWHPTKGRGGAQC